MLLLRALASRVHLRLRVIPSVRIAASSAVLTIARMLRVIPYSRTHVIGSLSLLIERTGRTTGIEGTVMSTATRTMLAGVLLGLIASAWGCAAEPPQPVERQVSETLTAKVVALDPEARLLELQGPFNTVTIEVPADVHDFKSINVGDEVEVTYYIGLAAVFADKSANGDAARDEEVAVQSGSAATPPGTPPGRAVGRSVTARVTIQSVDKEFHTVTFTGPRGLTRVIGVKDPKMQTFAEQLKPGDQVDITYYEALAARVIPQQ